MHQNVQIIHTMYFIQSSAIIQNSEFYIIIFLNRLIIVENTPKNGGKKIKLKCLWLRLWDPLDIHRPLLDTPVPGMMCRQNPPLIRPGRHRYRMLLRFTSDYAIYDCFHQ